MGTHRRVEPHIDPEIVASLGKIVILCANLEYYTVHGCCSLYPVEERRRRWSEAFDLTKKGRRIPKTGRMLLKHYGSNLQVVLGPLLTGSYSTRARSVLEQWNVLEQHLGMLLTRRNDLVHGAWIAGDSSPIRIAQAGRSNELELSLLRMRADDLRALEEEIAVLAADALYFFAVAAGLAETHRLGAPP